MNIGVVIPAAGQGKRMGTKENKQFLYLNDLPILVHTIKTFFNIPLISEIIVVVPEARLDFCQEKIIDKYNLEGVKLVAGGETRRQSVFSGLKAFSLALDYVIIHDGARPLLSGEILDNIISSFKTYDAITTGVKVKDTIKIRDENNFVNKTLDRDKLMSIQTPQAFSYPLILKAHQKVSFTANVSDDASLVEITGHRVKIIEGSYENIKITTPDDLKQAEIILENRGEVK